MTLRSAGILFLASAAGLFPLVSHAAALLSVTEIMYDVPGANTGHQWIKISNVGDASIDLGAKTIRLFDSSGRHLIKTDSETTGGSTVLFPDDTLVIAQNPTQFHIEYPDFQGTVLKSSFSLTAAGTVGIMQTDGTVLASGKPIAKKASSIKKAAASRSTAASTRKTSSKTAYDTGTVAPDASADAAASGALSAASLFRGLPIPDLPVFSSVWFAGFLGLLAFSGFSLILIRTQPIGKTDAYTSYGN